MGRRWERRHINRRLEGRPWPVWELAALRGAVTAVLCLAAAGGTLTALARAAGVIT